MNLLPDHSRLTGAQTDLDQYSDGCSALACSSRSPGTQTNVWGGGGKADVYPRLGPTMEWDTAAGHAIVLCANGTVVLEDLDSNLKYNKENLLNPYFIVAKRAFDLK